MASSEEEDEVEEVGAGAIAIATQQKGAGQQQGGVGQQQDGGNQEENLRGASTQRDHVGDRRVSGSARGPSGRAAGGLGPTF